jgi:hypothetical protein
MGISSHAQSGDAGQKLSKQQLKHILDSLSNVKSDPKKDAQPANGVKIKVSVEAFAASKSSKLEFKIKGATYTLGEVRFYDEGNKKVATVAIKGESGEVPTDYPFWEHEGTYVYEVYLDGKLSKTGSTTVSLYQPAKSRGGKSGGGGFR